MAVTPNTAADSANTPQICIEFCGFVFRKVAKGLPDKLYLKLRYLVAMGFYPDLKNPRRYTEKLQWLKLHDRNPRYHAMADKAEVKKLVADLVGQQYVIPTLGVWDRVEDVDWDSLPDSFVIKCTHDSGSTVVCESKATFDKAAAVNRLRAALAVDYYRKGDREWVYKGLKPRIIAEAFIGHNIADYKFFCFDGQPRIMFVATDRGEADKETCFDFFDMDYRHLDIRNWHPNAAVEPARPANWELMKQLAATLSKGFPHVRVDLYEADGKVYFGEYTMYHWGGLVPFVPDEWDFRLGDMLKLPE